MKQFISPLRASYLRDRLDTSATQFDFTHVVLQPTTRCNLNCCYCYLPDRARAAEMPVEITAAIADDLKRAPHIVNVLWHGGEPLACGLRKFRQLVKPFARLRASGKVRHSLQSNATLITQEWCEFFKEENFRVGVSLDGPEHQNTNRLNWGGKPSFSSVLKGIEALRENGIRFGVIAVVNTQNMDDPAAFYEFFLSLGCERLNINVEEREGLNQLSDDLDFHKVSHFWEGLFNAWRLRPALRIREFDNALGWMEDISRGDHTNQASFRVRDLWPTVAFNGDVVVLSPELMAVNDSERSRFIVGNVLQTPLHDIVKDSWQRDYVQDFIAGLRECRRTCAYYSYCGGGQASNKYFELGCFNATETAHCRNTRQVVIDVVLASLSKPSMCESQVKEGGV